MIKFGDIIRYERLKLGYTQRDVAKLLGIKHDSSVSQYELNKHKPTLTILKKLCDMYVLDFNEMAKLVYGCEIEYTFANIIKMKRQELKMNVEEVSKKVGISTASICDYETKHVEIPAQNIYRLCKFYKLNYNEILDMFYPMDYTTIGSLLRNTRKRLGLTRAEVIGKLGYNQNYLSNIENGFRNPDYRRLYELCDLYDLDYHQICKDYYGDDTNSLGYKLKMSRIAKNMHQSEVANKLCMSDKLISSIENNRYKPHCKLIIDLCEIYDLDINEIYNKYYGDELKDSLGLKLRNMRLEKSLKPEEVAELIGVSEVSIFNYESNKSVPSNEVLQKLYKTYDVIRFGDIIRYERIKLGYTQLDVEKLLNIDRRGITNYENNKHTPKLNVIKKLCDLYSLDFEEMLKLIFGKDFKLTYGALFKMAREELGYSQLEVCDLIGASKTAIHNYENDRAIPTKYMNKLCELYGFDRDKLILSMHKLKLDTFGSRLKFERLKRSMSVFELGPIVGISDDCIYTYENNTVIPPYKRVKILCDYFNMDFDKEINELYPMSKETLGDYLRSIRIRNGLTQVEAAEKIGMVENAIIYFETNVQKPRYSTLRNICKFYNLDIAKVYEEFYGTVLEDNLGTRLKNMRLDKGLTQRKVGELLGVSKTTIGNFEKGAYTPDEEMLNRMYELYKIEE